MSSPTGLHLWRFMGWYWRLSKSDLYSQLTVYWSAIFGITDVLDMSTRNSLSKFNDPLDVRWGSVDALKTLWTLARFHQFVFCLQNVCLSGTGHYFLGLAGVRCAAVSHVTPVNHTEL